MPPVIIAGAIAATGAVAGAAISSNSAKKASDTATQAADKNAQIQQQQFEQVRSDLAPNMQAGNIATAGILQRLGLATPGAPSGSTAGVANGSGGTGGALTAASGGLSSAQVQQIAKDRPDVVQAFNQTQALANSGNRDAQQALAEHGGASLDGFLQNWYSTIRPAAGDQYQVSPQPSTIPAQPDTGQAQTGQPSPVPGQTFTSANNGGLGDRAALPRPTFTEAAPTFGPAPTSATYLDPASFTTSPGYQFRLDQGTRNLNASYGARGLLKSDAAIKGINDYSQGQASSEYGNWFNQGLQRLGADQNQYNQNRAAALAQYNQDRNVFNTNYNADTSRYDANYNTDRAYNTGEYNQYTSNLFALSGMGQNAAAGVGAAGQNYASQATANNNALASVQGNAAIASGNAWSNGINGVSQAAGMYANPFSVNTAGWGSGTNLTPMSTQTAGLQTATPATIPSYGNLYNNVPF